MVNQLCYLNTTVYNFLFSKYYLLFNNLQYFSNIFPKWIAGVAVHAFSLTIALRKGAALNVFFFLQKHSACLFAHLLDITVVDLLFSQGRFQVFYQLASLQFNSRLTCSLIIQEHELVTSVAPLYASAGWFEAEIWDLFGVYFEGHTKIHRLLTDYGFRHYPLRKDFPLSGYTELFYNEAKQMVGYYKVSVSQEFRNYTFSNPWALPNTNKLGLTNLLC